MANGFATPRYGISLKNLPNQKLPIFFEDQFAKFNACSKFFRYTVNLLTVHQIISRLNLFWVHVGTYSSIGRFFVVASWH